MPIEYIPEVKRILKAAGYTDAQIKTSEVRAEQDYNKSRDLPPATKDLPERFTNPDDLVPTVAKD